jgi:hypothetical protein
MWLLLLSYSRKFGLFGNHMSNFLKGVSPAVHNIVFLLSPDHFQALEFKFAKIFQILFNCNQTLFTLRFTLFVARFARK